MYSSPFRFVFDMQQFSNICGGGAKYRWLLAQTLKTSVPDCGCIGRVDTDVVLCYDGRGWSALVGLVNFWDVVELIDEINCNL